MFISFRFREYRIFWIGNATSNIGIWLLGAGRLWLMYDLTDSEIMLGLVTFANLVPILALSMWGGVIADRINRVKLVTVTRAMFAFTAILTGLLIFTDLILPWHLIAISLVNGILLSFDIPCRQAIVPNLVPLKHLVNAVSLQSMLGSGSAVLGPSLLPIMIRFWNIEGVFFFIGGMYIFTTLMFSKLETQPISRESKSNSPLKDLLSGLSYIKNNHIIIALISIGVTSGLFASSLPTVLPVFATDILSGDIETYSSLLLSNGIGGIAGALILASLVGLRSSPAVQIISGLGSGIGFVALSTTGWYEAAIVIYTLTGVSSVIFGTINNTLLQSIVDDSYRGRVMSIHQIGWGASAIGGLIVGTLAEIYSVSVALALCGMITAITVGSLSVFVSKTLSNKNMVN